MIKHILKIIFISLLFSFNVFAQSTPIAKVVWVKGTLTANGKVLQKRSSVYQNDVLRTGSQSQAQLVFSDNALLTLKENTSFSVDSYQFKKSTSSGSFVGNLVTGGFRTVTGLIGKHDPEDYEIKTPVATLGVRGTDYQAVMNNGALYVEVFRGKVCMNNSASSAPTSNNGISTWINKPAVYLPQVLAITDEQVILPQGCPDGAAPTYLTGIDPDQRTASGTGSVDFAPFFTGNNLTFSITSISPPLDPGVIVEITPAGILSFDYTAEPGTNTIIVTASNACGSASAEPIVVGDIPA